MGSVNKRYKYFRVTRHLQYSMDCDGWYNHFRDLGIPCALVKNSKRSPHTQFSVWVIGAENCGDPKYPSSDTKSNTERLTGKVLIECFNFSVKGGL